MLLGRGRGLGGWAPLVVVLLLAGCVRTGITYLHHSAEAHLREETTLVRLDGLVQHLRYLKDQARQPNPQTLSTVGRE